MSDSWNTEQDIEKFVSELYTMISDLERAKEILFDMRESSNTRERYSSLKQRAKDWMKP